MSHIHWVPRGTGTPKDRDEVKCCLLWIKKARVTDKTYELWGSVREIHECDGRAHDPVTMVVPLTPKPTRKAEPLFILETKTKVGSTVAKTPVPRTHPNILIKSHFLNETCVMYLKRLWYSGNNMFDFHECELAIQKYKNMKTDTLCVTLDYTNISQSLVRIQTRTRSQRLCGWGRRRRQTQTLQPSSRCPLGRPSSYISRRCSNFKLVWVSTRRSTNFWPNLFLLFEWIQPSINKLCSYTDAEPISLMCSRMRSTMKSIVFSWPIVSMETRRVCRERTTMMMFTMGRSWSFPKLFHVDGIVSLPTFQWSLSHLSVLYFLVLVPPFHFLDNLSMSLNVLRRWFTLLHLLRNTSQDQVVPDVDGPEIVSKTTKQASFWVTLLLPTLARESTFQNMIGLHFYYWSIVVLCQGILLSVTLRPTCRRHLCLSSVLQSVFFMRVFFLKEKNIFGLRKGVSH